MPDSPGRPGLRRWVCRSVSAVVAVTALSLLIVPAQTAAATSISATRTGAAAADDPCAAPADFSDHQAVVAVAVACLRATDDHIAIIGDDNYVASQFTDAVDRARAHNVDLSVVVLGQEAGDAGPTPISDGVQNQVGGTVVVVTPDHFAISTDQFGQADIEKARDAASVGDDAQVVTRIVDSLTAKPFPWLLAVLVTIAVLVLGAFAGGLWTRRRRRHADAEALAELTEGLAGRVNDLAPTIVSITDEVDIAGRPDLEDRFDHATVDYNELRDLLATPLASRAAVNDAAARVQELGQELAEVDAEVSATPPSTRARSDGHDERDRGPSAEPPAG